MYLKLAGCICVILAASGYGYGKGLEYKRHVQELEGLSRIIWQIQGEIAYTKAPLSEICSRVGRRSQSPYREWLFALGRKMEQGGQGSLEQVWREEAEKNLTEMCLTNEEMEELKRLGGQMGYLDIRMQEQTFAWYGGRLNEKKQRLESELAEKRKLCSCLGVMCGLFLAILFV